MAQFVGHAAVGVAAGVIAAKAVKGSGFGPAIVVGIIAILIHQAADAPAAKVASELGL